jgi:hypothetical protein
MNNQSCDTVNIVPARRKIGNTRISVSGLYPFKKIPQLPLNQLLNGISLFD